MEITLLSMAAGIGSIYGAGIKQREPVEDYGLLNQCYHL